LPVLRWRPDIGANASEIWLVACSLQRLRMRWHDLGNVGRRSGSYGVAKESEVLTIQIDENTSPWDIDEYVAVLKKLSKVRLKAYEEMCEEERPAEAAKKVATND